MGFPPQRQVALPHPVPAQLRADRVQLQTVLNQLFLQRFTNRLFAPEAQVRFPGSVYVLEATRVNRVNTVTNFMGVHRPSADKRLIPLTLLPRTDLCEFSRSRSRLDHLLVTRPSTS